MGSDVFKRTCQLRVATYPKHAVRNNKCCSSVCTHAQFSGNQKPEMALATQISFTTSFTNINCHPDKNNQSTRFLAEKPSLTLVSDGNSRLPTMSVSQTNALSQCTQFTAQPEFYVSPTTHHCQSAREVVASHAPRSQFVVASHAPRSQSRDVVASHAPRHQRSGTWWHRTHPAARIPRDVVASHALQGQEIPPCPPPNMLCCQAHILGLWFQVGPHLNGSEEAIQAGIAFGPVRQVVSTPLLMGKLTHNRRRGIDWGRTLSNRFYRLSK